MEFLVGNCHLKRRPFKMGLFHLSNTSWVWGSSRVINFITSELGSYNQVKVKVKVIPQQAEVAQGVPGSLRPRIFLTFGNTRVVGHQPYSPAAFTPGEIPGTHFQRLSRPQGTWFHQEPWKKSPVTPPGIDLGTTRLVAQCLNHYATPGSSYNKVTNIKPHQCLAPKVDAGWHAVCG